MTLRVVFLSLWIFLAQIHLVFGQIQFDDIKSNEDYIWAEGVSKSEDDAYFMAVKRLSERMNIKLNSVYDLQTENETESFYSRVKISSSVRFELLNSYSLKGMNDEFTVLVYLKKSDYLQQLETKSKDLKSTYNFLKNKDINLVAAEWIKLWIDLVSLPFDISVTDSNAEVSLTSIVQYQLNSYIEQAAISINTPKPDASGYTIQTSFSNADLNEQNFAITIVDGNHYYSSFVAKTISLKWNQLPNKPKTEIDFQLSFSDKLLVSGSENFIRSAFHKLIRIPVDFSVINPVTVTISKNKGSYIELTANINHVELETFEWLFPDGSVSSDFKVSISKKSNAFPYTIKIKVNGYTEWERDVIINSNYQLASEIIIEEIPDLIEFIKTKKSIDLDFLNEKKLAHEIIFGSKKHINHSESSWIIIVKPKSGEIVDILTPIKESKRYSLFKKQSVSNVEEQYKGSAPLYIEILK